MAEAAHSSRHRATLPAPFTKMADGPHRGHSPPPSLYRDGGRGAFARTSCRFPAPLQRWWTRTSSSPSKPVVPTKDGGRRTRTTRVRHVVLLDQDGRTSAPTADWLGRMGGPECGGTDRFRFRFRFLSLSLPPPPPAQACAGLGFSVCRRREGERE
ncbi:hypothetical protein chiPu_0021810 [Chiloscyllium punctatum]|uniref:Uncharacterized protein n=1 Tax=Chiloscyllium punctatum TaxID=137246 RepID=A0A401RMD4_CHIPU|nr:hypothetical protein [Chiloscyllium punctatum]